MLALVLTSEPLYEHKTWSDYGVPSLQLFALRGWFRSADSLFTRMVHRRMARTDADAVLDDDELSVVRAVRRPHREYGRQDRGEAAARMWDSFMMGPTCGGFF